MTRAKFLHILIDKVMIKQSSFKVENSNQYIILRISRCRLLSYIELLHWVDNGLKKQFFIKNKLLEDEQIQKEVITYIENIK